MYIEKYNLIKQLLKQYVHDDVGHIILEYIRSEHTIDKYKSIQWMKEALEHKTSLCIVALRAFYPTTLHLTDIEYITDLFFDQQYKATFIYIVPKEIQFHQDSITIHCHYDEDVMEFVYVDELEYWKGKNIQDIEYNYILSFYRHL